MNIKDCFYSSSVFEFISIGTPLWTMNSGISIFDIKLGMDVGHSIRVANGILCSSASPAPTVQTKQIHKTRWLIK